MMWKKLLIAGAAVIVAALGITVYCTQNIPIIKTPYTVELMDYQLTYDDEGRTVHAQASFDFVADQVLIGEVYFSNGQGYRAENNLAARLDPEKLVALFARSTTRRTGKIHSYPLAEVTWIINLQQNHRSIHIVLGKRDFWYEGSGGCYRIVDGDAIEAALARMLAQSEAAQAQ